MVKLGKFEREMRKGINLAVKSPDQKGMIMYLWFYEWNMFNAARKGQHTGCDQNFSITISANQKQAVITSENIELKCHAVLDGVDLLLSLTNNTDYEWPEISGIIPCLNPGNPFTNSPPLNRLFIDDEHVRTFFLGPKGFELLQNREIHFNERLRSAVDLASPDGNFEFSFKWPTSEINANAGILVRESEDGHWVTGIAWKDFLSVQGHNPLKCMHVCVGTGPLKPSETKTIRGKIYLFKGKKEDCLKKYLKDFAIRHKIENP